MAKFNIIEGGPNSGVWAHTSEKHLHVLSADGTCGILFHSVALDECVICDLFTNPMHPAWVRCHDCNTVPEDLIPIIEMLKNYAEGNHVPAQK